MLIRAKTNHSNPKALFTHVEPTSVKQALARLDWHKAIQLMYNSFFANQTWTLITLSPHRKRVGWKWVSKVKENLDGIVNNYKARLAAKGCHQ